MQIPELTRIARREIARDHDSIVGVGRHLPTGSLVHILDERELWGQSELLVTFPDSATRLQTWWDARRIEVRSPRIDLTPYREAT